jgi:hypothetical protein
MLPAPVAGPQTGLARRSKMNLEIHKPESVQRVNAYIRTGHFRDADELLEKVSEGSMSHAGRKSKSTLLSQKKDHSLDRRRKPPRA